jgi:hypothetical protein
MSASVNSGGSPIQYTNNSGSQPAYMIPDVQAPAATDTSAIGTSPTGLLTPDALMAYVETRLDGLNSQMQAIFQQEQATANITTKVDNMVGVLNSYSNGFNVSGGDTNQADYENVLSQLNALETEAGGPNTSAGAGIANAIQTFQTNGNGGQDNKVSSTDIANMVKDLQTVASDAGSSSQLNMINLQSLMSQQQTAIQITTNLVQQLGQQNQAIATNVGK